MLKYKWNLPPFSDENKRISTVESLTDRYNEKSAGNKTRKNPAESLVASDLGLSFHEGRNEG